MTLSFWTAENIRTACGGVFVARPSWLTEPGANISGVTTDSRAVAPGQVFFALRGETFDGHDFLSQVSEAGAVLLVIDRADVALPAANAGPRGLGVGVLKVADARKALGRLAQAYRRSLERTKVIAVCGSNGKTTTVRIIDGVLSARLRGTASKKSFNNDIGVPLTILSAKPTDQYLICEVGTNAPGEIAALGKIVEPDIAVITSIGREHLEKLVSVEGVAREEAAILACIRPGGIGIVTADSAQLNAVIGSGAAALGPAMLRFGKSVHADLRLTECKQAVDEQGRGAVQFTVNARQAFSLPLAGEHNACNALAAIAVARRLGLDDATITAGLRSVNHPEMRWQVTPLAIAGGSVQVINDAYNANPDSMLAAIATFGALYGAGRRVMVMGDMFELGEAAAQGHRDVALAALRSGLAVLVTIGAQSRAGAVQARAIIDAEGVAGGDTARGEARVVSFDTLDEATMPRVACELMAGDAVLVKGSRRMRLERLIAMLSSANIRTTPGAERSPQESGA